MASVDFVLNYWKMDWKSSWIIYHCTGCCKLKTGVYKQHKKNKYAMQVNSEIW